MKRTAVLTMVAMAFLLISGSCSRHTAGVKIDPETLGRIKRGETTKQQVLTLLGAPQGTFLQDGEEMFTYSYASTRVSGKSYIPFAGPFVGGASTEHQQVMISFDENGIVQSISKQEGAQRYGH